MSVTVNYQLKCLLFTRSPSETWQLRSSPLLRTPSERSQPVFTWRTRWEYFIVNHTSNVARCRMSSGKDLHRYFLSARVNSPTRLTTFYSSSIRSVALPTQPSKTACASSRLHSLTALTSQTFMLGKLLSNRPSFSRQRTGINASCTALSAGRQRMSNENINACLLFTEERKRISLAYCVGFITHPGRHRIMIARYLVSIVDDRSAYAWMSIINAGSRPFDFEETKREEKKWRAH